MSKPSHTAPNQPGRGRGQTSFRTFRLAVGMPLYFATTLAPKKSGRPADGPETRRRHSCVENLLDVRHVLVRNAVTSIDRFTTDLRTAGFTDIRTTDLTEETEPFVAARLAT